MAENLTQQTESEQPEAFTLELSDEQLDQVAGTGDTRCQNNLKQLGLAMHVWEP